MLGFSIPSATKLMNLLDEYKQPKHLTKEIRFSDRYYMKRNRKVFNHKKKPRAGMAKGI